MRCREVRVWVCACYNGAFGGSTPWGNKKLNPSLIPSYNQNMKLKLKQNLRDGQLGPSTDTYSLGVIM